MYTYANGLHNIELIIKLHNKESLRFFKHIIAIYKIFLQITI